MSTYRSGSGLGECKIVLHAICCSNITRPWPRAAANINGSTSLRTKSQDEVYFVSKLRPHSPLYTYGKQEHDHRPTTIGSGPWVLPAVIIQSHGHDCESISLANTTRIQSQEYRSRSMPPEALALVDIKTKNRREEQRKEARWCVQLLMRQKTVTRYMATAIILPGHNNRSAPQEQYNLLLSHTRK